MPSAPANSPLPYSHTKTVGSADFYFAINATFRFIESKLGREALLAYWGDLGTQYFAPVSAKWKCDGIAGVAAYWRAFFDAEPGSEVEIAATPQQVVLNVRVCPAINHLRVHSREIVPCFCQHCYHVNEAMAAPAGLTVRVEGGNGSCRQTFLPRNIALAPQDFSRIKEAT